MESKSEYFEDLRIIKKVMEESSRFLSLSGLSGLFAGIIALAGAAFAIYTFRNPDPDNPLQQLSRSDHKPVSCS